MSENNLKDNVPISGGHQTSKRAPLFHLNDNINRSIMTENEVIAEGKKAHCDVSKFDQRRNHSDMCATNLCTKLERQMDFTPADNKNFVGNSNKVEPSMSNFAPQQSDRNDDTESAPPVGEVTDTSNHIIYATADYRYIEKNNQHFDGTDEFILEEDYVAIDRNNSRTKFPSPKPKELPTIGKFDSERTNFTGIEVTPQVSQPNVGTEHELTPGMIPDNEQATPRQEMEVSSQDDSADKHASPSDSDSFDWRNEIVSPMMVQAKYIRTRRRSSFLLPRRPPRLSESPTTSENSTPAATTPESSHNDLVGSERLAGEKGIDLFSADRCDEPMAASTSPLFSTSPHVLPTVASYDSQLGSELYLGSIYEDAEESSSSGGETQMLHAKCNRLELENCRLRDRLEAKSKCYDNQILPFRNLFEDLPKLRRENEHLRRENAELKKHKADMETNVAETIQQLQSQMANAVKVAVEKTGMLQMELNASQRRNEELERQLIELQNSRVTQVDHTAG